MELVFGLVGGLGLFLFGMRNMAEGLQKMAGEKLRHLLEVLTSNIFMGVLVGTLVTALIQSSSTTTVMVVGFVNAGLMTLNQAVGVIMGANIGTTITAQLIAFKVEEYALPTLGLGVALFIFGRSKKTKYLGEIFMGFGMLFLGLDIMSGAMQPLAESEAFRNIAISLAQHPILGVLVGAGMTGIIQSSSASVGILQSLASEGAISFQTALPILFGDNIGTTVTAVLASIGTNVTAKRAAGIHFIFNVIGTIIFILLIPLITPIIMATSQNVVRQIANAHTIFNLTNTLIQLPFAGLIVWLVMRLIPGEAPVTIRGPQYLENRFLRTPFVALDLVYKEIMVMADLARDIVKISLDAIHNHSDNLKEAYDKEDAVNVLNREITKYLTELAKQPLSDQQRDLISKMYHIVAHIEKVGDHGENIADLAIYCSEHNLSFSPSAYEELKELSEVVLNSFDEAMLAWNTKNVVKAKEVFQLENKTDQIEEAMWSRHIDRLNNGECNPSAGVIFLDLASNLERIGDKSANIAGLVPGVKPKILANADLVIEKEHEKGLTDIEKLAQGKR